MQTKEAGNSMAEPVTIAILNYNGRKYLEQEIASIRSMTYRPVRLIFVDDGSTDGSVEYIKNRHPDIEVHECSENVRFLNRYPYLNRVRNRALNAAKTRLVFLVDKTGNRFLIENTLDEIESRIDPNRFFRINRQMIVSLEAVTTIHPYFNSRLKLILDPPIKSEILVSRGRDRTD